LRHVVASQSVVVNDEARASVTVSIGVATLVWRMGLTFERLVNKRLRALYQAKETGRNNVQCCADMSLLSEQCDG
jgi:diguanylate cyclase (GGDEF)-like protein